METFKSRLGLHGRRINSEPWKFCPKIKHGITFYWTFLSENQSEKGQELTLEMR
jgi:hypothetical protein